jgi:thioester reductase-like protein
LDGGYALSKRVAELVLEHARTTTDLHAVVARVGQLCGSTINGYWNANEWFPLMVRSAKSLGCLPERSQVSVHQFSVKSGNLIFTL